MLFTTTTIENKEIESINNFFNEYENSESVKVVEAEVEEKIETPVSKYLSSLVTSQYKKSVEDIENTKVGNRLVRKRNFQQVMKESFFYGANRFGTNFIA